MKNKVFQIPEFQEYFNFCIKFLKKLFKYKKNLRIADNLIAVRQNAFH